MFSKFHKSLENILILASFTSKAESLYEIPTQILELLDEKIFTTTKSVALLGGLNFLCLSGGKVCNNLEDLENEIIVEECAYSCHRSCPYIRERATQKLG